MEVADGAAVRQADQGEPEHERDRDDPVAAERRTGRRKLRAESQPAVARDEESRVLREERLDRSDDDEREPGGVSDDQPEADEEAADGRHGEVPDRARDGAGTA